VARLVAADPAEDSIGDEINHFRARLPKLFSPIAAAPLTGEANMRKYASSDGLSVNAIAGSFVVILGFNIKESMRKGLRGFAVKRLDVQEGESFWMTGMKTFEDVEPHPAPGEQFSSHIHPFQSFQWSDYSAKPGRQYKYTIVAMYGDPGALVDKQSVTVAVTTEPTEKADHAIFFNRGSVASQEYARRFQNQPPSKAGQGAYDWLSRGLVEAIIAFIGRASGKKAGLKGAFYEFQNEKVLEALRDAKDRGGDVRIVFDDIDAKTGPRKANEAAIKDARIKGLCIPRQNGKLMHNKFLVLTDNGKALALLFGSTNLTENGIYGHANCVHIVEDETIADKYLTYFKKLTSDPDTSGRSNEYKKWTVDQTPAPAEKFPEGMAPVFSPRSSEDALNWYGDLAGGAKGGLFMTFAFGMSDVFKKVYGSDDGVLKLGLMEKEWNGANKDAQIAAIRALQKLPDVVIAIGNHIPMNGFDQWLAEIDHITGHVHVHWVHLKFMLVDPLSDNPTVVTGSANFSSASTVTNDENMIVIKNNKRVADVYLGEYMRLYSHYAWREAVDIFLKRNPGKTAEQMKLGFLVDKGDWTKDYFSPKDTTGRRLRREYFAGH
jgi:phosphatidylserine/phosphatidylglycerophosphate/cardiolipin synthase-like enzyme